MLIIELNEFCPSYLEEVSNKLKLNNLKKILDFDHTVTISQETEEFHGLDPWVQWVSIHNGIPLKEHKIKRLGLPSKNSDKQIWNVLSKDKNIKWIAIGLMNAMKGNNKGCLSFAPDPWSSNEKAYPKELNHLLDLPRYISKNYLSLDFFKVIKKSLRTLLFFLNFENLDISKKLLTKFTKSIFNPGINIHTLTTLFDYLLVLYFTKKRIKYNPQLSIIFLNHIAHLQHHFCLDSPEIHPQMVHGMKICNEIFGILLKKSILNKEKILIINALKQKRSGKEGIQVYRQLDSKKLLEKLDIKEVRIDQNMTNDGNLTFKNSKDRDKAYAILFDCHLSTGEKVFFIEKISNIGLFMQLNINHFISKDTFIITKKKSILFYDLFINLQRTGSHIPNGDIFSKNMKLPKKIQNQEIYKYIINSF